MKCQFCDSPATVHLTDIVNKKKREVHLCERCARKHNLLPDAPAAPPIDLKALLGLLVGPFQQPHADPAALTCPTCGLQYGEFRAEGRLGCPADYEAFRPALEPLLERIHRARRHAGKAPRAYRRQLREAELRDLRGRMSAAAAGTRMLGELARLGETEARFYKQLAPELGSVVPRSHGSEFDPLTGRYVIVLEDMTTSPCEFPDTLNPLDNDKMAQLVESLAHCMARFGGVCPKSPVVEHNSGGCGHRPATPAPS